MAFSRKKQAKTETEVITKMKAVKLVCIVLLATFQVHVVLSSQAGSAALTQQQDAGMNVLWNQTYGGPNRDDAYSIVQTSDGGYAIAGSTTSFGAGGYDFWLLRISSIGEALWNQTYGGASDDNVRFMIQTSDGGYAIVGVTRSFSNGQTDMLLVKTTANGEMQWRKNYGGYSYDQAYSIVQTGGGGYTIAGYTESYGAGGRDVWLIKTDSAGNVVWNKTYGGARNDYVQQAMIRASDGGYALACCTESYGAGNSDFWVIKTDSSGNVQWNKTYGWTSWDEPHSIIQTDDGSYVIAGATKSVGAGDYDVWILKISSSGIPQWNSTYGGADYDGAKSVIPATDGGYLLAGWTDSFGSGGHDLWLVKTDDNGDMQWNQTYGGADDDLPFSIVVTGEDGYAIVGLTESYAVGGDDAWLLKLGLNTIEPHSMWTEWWFWIIVGLCATNILSAFLALRYYRRTKTLGKATKPEQAKTRKSESFITCSNCGAQLPADAEFCGKCGNKL